MHMFSLVTTSPVFYILYTRCKLCTTANGITLVQTLYDEYHSIKLAPNCLRLLIYSNDMLLHTHDWNNIYFINKDWWVVQSNRGNFAYPGSKWRNSSVNTGIVWFSTSDAPRHDPNQCATNNQRSSRISLKFFLI